MFTCEFILFRKHQISVRQQAAITICVVKIRKKRKEKNSLHRGLLKGIGSSMDMQPFNGDGRGVDRGGGCKHRSRHGRVRLVGRSLFSGIAISPKLNGSLGVL